MSDMSIGEEIAVTTYRHLRAKHRWYPGAEERIRKAARELPMSTMRNEDIFYAVKAIVRGEMADGYV